MAVSNILRGVKLTRISVLALVIAVLCSMVFSIVPVGAVVADGGAVSVRVVASAEDSGYLQSGGAYDNTYTELRIGLETNSETEGMIFTGINIPAGQHIVSAKITWTASASVSSQTVGYTIKGELAASPADYGAAEDFTSRTYTTAYAAKAAVSTSWTLNSTYDSVDMTSVVQELYTAYAPYSSGVMAFEVLNNGSTAGNYLPAYSYDGSTTKAPLLVITYSPNDLYWVGNTGSWSQSSTHWAANSGGSPAAGNIPDSSTNVYFDASSFSTTGRVVTIDVTGNCLDMIWTGALYSPKISDNNHPLGIYGLLTLVSGMTFEGYSDNYHFKALSGTKNITWGGATVTAESMVFGGAATWIFQDGLSGGGGITLTTGTLDTNGKTLSITGFNFSGSGVRGLTLGSSIIYCATWTGTTTTNLSFSGASSTIYCTGDFQGGSLTYGSVTMTTGASWNITLGGSNSFTNLTLASSSSSKTIHMGGNQTVSSLLTFSGSSATNRLLIDSSSGGAQRTVMAATLGTCQYVDFKDINASGASAPWNVSAITGSSADLGNNSDITFAHQCYWVGGSGNWSSGTNWSYTSGGTANANWTTMMTTGSVNDYVDVHFDANSGFTAISRTVSVSDGTYADCHDMDWTGALFSPIFNVAGNAATYVRIYGDLTFITAMSIADPGGTGVRLDFLSSSVGNIIDVQGLVLGATNKWSIYFGGIQDWTLSSAIGGAGTIYLEFGTLDTNDETVTCSAFYSNYATARSLVLGSSTISCASWDISTATNLTPSFVSSTINDSGNFYGGGLTYGTVNLTGSATVIVSGDNTFTTFSIARVTRTVHFTAGSTQTATTFSFPTSGAIVLTMNSTSGGSAWYLVQATGTVNTEYLSLQDSHASGGAPFFAGSHSTNVSNNTGWIFGSVTPTTTPITVPTPIGPTTIPAIIHDVTGGSEPSSQTVNEGIPLVGIAIFVGTFLNVPAMTIVTIGAMFLLFALGFFCVWFRLGPVITGVIMAAICVMFKVFYVFDYWMVFMVISFILVSWLLPRQTAMLG